MSHEPVPLPAHGRAPDEILAEMQTRRAHDLAWRDGRVFSLVFAADPATQQLAHDAYSLFMAENALNPGAFPSLRRFETEVVGMAASILGGGVDVVGNMTSGGTESLLLAVLAAREWARRTRPHITRPNLILPVSAHPALDKAGHYFGVELVRTPLGLDYRADVAAMRAAITPDTILLVGSAPSYPHGMIDPIEEMGALAREYDLLLHVDACMGGFLLPFARKLGHAIPPFDFSAPGVTSISADLHKYGYAAKGASVILYRDKALRRGQYFAVTEWPGGIYASPSMLGTRAGGVIAAAWAVMQHLGEEGYTQLVKEVMDSAERIKQGVRAIEGLYLVGDPPASLLAIAANRFDIYQVADEMSVRGWHLDRQHKPPSLHMTVNYAHVQQTDAFLADLRASAQAVQAARWRGLSQRLLVGSAAAVRRLIPDSVFNRLSARLTRSQGPDQPPQSGRSAPMYGLIGALPDRGEVKELVLDLLEQLYT